MEQGLLLSYTQLFMLASAQGFDGIVGLPSHDCVVSEKKLMEDMAALTKAGLVSADGESFVCTPIGVEIGRRLGDSKVFVTVRSRKSRLPDFSCFFGSELMLCVPLLHHIDRVSVSFVQKEELLALLVDERYLPEDEEFFEPEDGELERYELPFWKQATEGALVEDGEIIFSMDAFDVSGEYIGSVRIVSYYFYRYIAEEFHGKIQRHQLLQPTVENALKRLLNPNDYC